MTLAAQDLSRFEDDQRLFVFTSLTSGSSHIVTATSRLETILKANKIPFQAIDIATDETARRLWQRRSGGRKLPGLVKDGFVVGDINEVEDWNEFGELKENLGLVESSSQPPAVMQQDPAMKDLAAQAASIGLTKQGDSSATAGDSAGAQTVAVGVETQVDDAAAKLACTGPVTPSVVAASSIGAEETSPAPAVSGSAVAPKEDSILSPPNPETMTSAPHVKGDTIVAADTAAHINEEAAATATKATSKHRGSEVIAVSQEEVAGVEKQNAIPETDEKLEPTASSPTTTVEAKESANTEDVAVKKEADGDAAGISVED